MRDPEWDSRNERRGGTGSLSARVQSWEGEHWRASRQCHPATRRGLRAVMLLEVIVALGLLAFGMVMVALQIDSGLKVARSNELRTRAMMLLDSKMDEMEAGIVQPKETEREIKGDFGIQHPGFSWLIKIDETDIEGFYMATMTIGYQAGAVQEQIDDPKKVIDIEDEGTLILQTAYRLFPKPADVNLERDFGLTQEDMEELLTALSAINTAAGAVEGGTDGTGGTGAMGDQSLADLVKSLLEMSDTGSFDPRMLSQLPDEQFLALATMLESMGFGRGNIQQVRQQFEQMQNLAAGGVEGLRRPDRGFTGRRGGDRAGGPGEGGGPGDAEGPGGPGEAGRPPRPPMDRRSDGERGNDRPSGRRSGRPSGDQAGSDSGSSGNDNSGSSGNRPPRPSGNSRPPRTPKPPTETK